MVLVLLAPSLARLSLSVVFILHRALLKQLLDVDVRHYRRHAVGAPVLLAGSVAMAAVGRVTRGWKLNGTFYLGRAVAAITHSAFLPFIYMY